MQLTGGSFHVDLGINLFDEILFEQRSEGSKGVRPVGIWKVIARMIAVFESSWQSVDLELVGYKDEIK